MKLYTKSCFASFMILTSIFASDKQIIVYQKPYLEQRDEQEKLAQQRYVENILLNCKIYNPKFYKKVELSKKPYLQRQAQKIRTDVSQAFIQGVMTQATQQAAQTVVAQEQQKIELEHQRQRQILKDFVMHHIKQKHRSTQHITNQRMMPYADFYAFANHTQDQLNAITTIMTHNIKTEAKMFKKSRSGSDIYELEMDLCEKNPTIPASKSDEQLTTSVKKPACQTVANHTIARRNKSDENVTLAYVVHGTFSDAKSFGENEDKPLTQDLLQFFQKLSLASQSRVEFHASEWSGALSHDERALAGKELAHTIVKDLDRHDPTGKLRQSGKLKIMLMGHSHGGNVLHNAAQNLKTMAYELQVDPKQLEIDTAIFMATPVLDIDPLTSKNGTYHAKRSINIYGLNDLTGSAGSGLTEVSKGLIPTFTLDKKYPAQSTDERLINIILKNNGKDPDHISIKRSAVQALPHILHKIDDSEFIVAQSLFANLVTDIETGKKSILACMNNNDPALPQRITLSAQTQELLRFVEEQGEENKKIFKQLYDGRKLTDKPCIVIYVGTEVGTKFFGDRSFKKTDTKKINQEGTYQENIIDMDELLETGGDWLFLEKTSPNNRRTP